MYRIQECKTRGYGRPVGLLGGSFNPAHLGHRHISLRALHRLGLREIWWVVTPGNPMKNAQELKSFATRSVFAEKVSDHPHIHICHFEYERGLVYTSHSLMALRAAHRDFSFVWIMGADNLVSFHLWDDWRGIMKTVPVAIFDRPGYRYRALSSPAATAYRAFRVREEEDAGNFAFRSAPAWSFFTGPLNSLSSTYLRSIEGDGGRGISV
ncbi:MAG: nicotinate-nucleotide adenylyltransferase [Alphaproteobacteria bacterium]|nr:nicotinate-nucleotide adenylyltransferase [Alphaproteobacteria bacterium]